MTNRQIKTEGSARPYPVVFLLVVLATTVAQAIPPKALNEIPESTWTDVTDGLLSIDAAIQADRTEEAFDALHSAASFWIEPFGSIAQKALDRLAEDPKTEAPGIMEVLAEIQRLDDDLLRASLENKILNAEPPIYAAIENIRLFRGNSAFYVGDVESALAEFRSLLRDFPASESIGIYQFNIAIALRDLERYRESIPEFERLFHLPVNNKEAEGTSIMEMGYRNYHHRAAVNIAWCYEQLGDLDSAAKWIELASTKYPYEGWCGVEINGARRHLDKAADRIAFAQGPIQGVSRILVVANKAWPAWTLLLGWCVVSGISARKSRVSLKRAIYASVPISWAASTSLIFLGLRDHSQLTDWILPGYYPEILTLVGGIFSVGTIAGVVFWKIGKSRVTARLLSGTCLVTSALLFYGLSQTGMLPPHFERYSLNDLQVLAFSYYSIPTAFFASGVALVLRDDLADRPE